MTAYQPVIGLEVHAELLTRSKMFCGCAVVDSIESEPNISVCEICTGMPGTLPVVNRRAVEFALRVALALDCEIAPESRFARKNYFYPDLPKGFQISQYESPLARNGRLPLDSDGESRLIRIRRVHLEEDTGKLFHHEGFSLVDFNRSGVPLLEIVSEPDLHSAQEALAYASQLRRLLRYLGVNSGDMEKGVIRFEANVSLRPAGSQAFGTRVEIKNLNSFRAMVRALEHEIQRQQEVLETGGVVRQETLGWDERASVTLSQRGKEEADDYRYFPEPDLPPLVISKTWIEQIRGSLPELPHAKRERMAEQYGLSQYMTSLISEEAAVADYFEAAVAAADEATPVSIANWLTGDLYALLNETASSLESSPFTAAHLAELVDLVESGTINATVGKEVLGRSFASGELPEMIVAEAGLEQESDPALLREIVDRILEDHPEQVRDYIGGKRTLAQWFFGQVMKETRGRADPSVVRSTLEEALDTLSHRTDSG